MLKRILLLISLDWTRNKDPRVPLGHASIVASVMKFGQVELHHRSFPVNQFFSPQKVVTYILKTISGFPSEAVDVAFGAFVWGEPFLQEIMTSIRQAGFKGRIILGGPQISYTDSGLEQLYPQADVFIRGSAEEALSEATVVHSPLSELERLGVHYAGATDLRTRAEADLSLIPSPYLSGAIPLFGLDGSVQRFIRWETKRGCPFPCTFCQHRESGHRLLKTEFPIDRIKDEIALFKRSGVEDIAILDAVFNLGRSSLIVLDSLNQADFRGRLSLQCHFEALTVEFLEALRSLYVRLEFGLQTIHASEGKAIKRINDMNKVDWGIKELLRRGIPFEVSVIYGLPGQTLFSFRETVNYLLKSRVPVIKAFPLMLLRGTELEQNRSRWSLRENGSTIPSVIASDSFTESEWKRMAAIGRGLELTEGRHPGSVNELPFDCSDLAGGKWSPLS